MKSSVALMGTVVTIEVVTHGGSAVAETEIGAAMDRAFDWFRRVEACCSRFDPDSEVSRLATQVGRPVRVSAMLARAVEFALAVADTSGGAFDPTVGGQLVGLGFDRNYRTGERVQALPGPEAVTYRDVIVDPKAQTVTLRRPIILDLGAVAKGLAIDLAALELQPFRNFAIDAGGDLYLSGHNAAGAPWSVGIRHPREDELIESLRVSNIAVCTSGDYERVSAVEPGRHHLVDPRPGSSQGTIASLTALAPTAMVADALGTAAFVLGPVEGLAYLEDQQVHGLIITTTLDRLTTRDFPTDRRLELASRGVQRHA